MTRTSYRVVATATLVLSLLAGTGFAESGRWREIRSIPVHADARVGIPYRVVIRGTDEALGRVRLSGIGWPSQRQRVRERGSGGSGGQWSSPTWYGQADFLIWWTKANPVPVLVSDGVLGDVGTSVLHGGGGIDDNYRPGVRFGLGCWLDPAKHSGIEFTWFSLGDGANSGNFFAYSDGSTVLARPFHNLDLLPPAEDALLAANIGRPGTTHVVTQSEMHSLALLLRQGLSVAGGSRLDLVGGYRFLRFRENLTIRDDTGGDFPFPNSITIVDAFGVENDFHGGEVGLSTVLDYGGWSLDLLTKIAAGNMHQHVSVAGTTAVISSPGGDAAITDVGLLTQSSNIGDRSRDQFALIPELNVNVRYRYSERLSLTMGYSLLWLTDMARTGDQIDREISFVGIPARPAPLLNQTSMWAQGLNFGVVFAY